MSAALPHTSVNKAVKKPAPVEDADHSTESAFDNAEINDDFDHTRDDGKVKAKSLVSTLCEQNQARRHG